MLLCFDITSNLVDQNVMVDSCSAFEVYPAFSAVLRVIFDCAFSIFDIWSRSWGVAQLLVFRGVYPHPHPSEAAR